MIAYDNASIPAPENLTLMASSNCSACAVRVARGEEADFPPTIRVVATAVCAVILVLGTAGNALVALVVCRTKELRNSTNLFLVNLSVADLLVLLVCVPTVLVELHHRPEVWLLGEGMCKAVPYVEMTAAHGSILTILAISFERYYAICRPLRAGYTCTQVRAAAIIAAVWGLAAAAAFPVLLTVQYQTVEYVDGSMVPVCLQMVNELWQQLYYLAVVGLLFLLPLLVLFVVYCHIARHLMLGRRVLASSSEDHQMRARRQVVLMLMAVVLCFFVCLLPFRLFTLWIIVAPSEQISALGMEAYYGLLYFCRLLLYANSALNPVLYNAISSKFRGSLIRLLPRVRIRRRHHRKGTATTTTSSTATTGSGSLKGTARQLRVITSGSELWHQKVGRGQPKPHPV